MDRCLACTDTDLAHRARDQDRTQQGQPVHTPPGTAYPTPSLHSPRQWWHRLDGRWSRSVSPAALRNDPSHRGSVGRFDGCVAKRTPRPGVGRRRLGVRLVPNSAPKRRQIRSCGPSRLPSSAPGPDRGRWRVRRSRPRLEAAARPDPPGYRRPAARD